MKRKGIAVVLVLLLGLLLLPTVASAATNHAPQPMLSRGGWGYSVMQADSYVVAGAQYHAFEDTTLLLLTVVLERRNPHTLVWELLDVESCESFGESSFVAASAPCEPGLYRMTVTGLCGAQSIFATKAISTGAGTADKIGAEGRLTLETKRAADMIGALLSNEENAALAWAEAEFAQEREWAVVKYAAQLSGEGMAWQDVQQSWAALWSGAPDPYAALEQRPELTVYHQLEQLRSRGTARVNALSEMLSPIQARLHLAQIEREWEMLQGLGIWAEAYGSGAKLIGCMT